MYIYRGAHRHVYAQRHICKDAHTYIFAYMYTETKGVVCLHTCINRYAQVFTDAQACTGLCSSIHVLRHKGIHVHTQSHLQVIHCIHHMGASIHVGMCVHTGMHMRTQRHTCAYPAHWWIPTRVLLMPSKCYLRKVPVPSAL